MGKHRKGLRKEYLSEFFYFVKRGIISPDCLEPREWFHIVNDSLESCRCILREVAEANKEAVTVENFLNCQRKGGNHSEMRITSGEVMQMLPPAFTCNKSWLLIPVVTLETKEEDGNFLERSLFILADFGKLLIVDVVFHKKPLNTQLLPNGTLFHEEVTNLKVWMNCDSFGLSAKNFFEMIMPYYGDSKRKLGQKIIERTLDDAVKELQKARQSVFQKEESMRPFLEARERLGYSNIL